MARVAARAVTTCHRITVISRGRARRSRARPPGASPGSSDDQSPAERRAWDRSDRAGREDSMALDNEQVVRHAYQVAEDVDLDGWVAAFTGDGTFTDES